MKNDTRPPYFGKLILAFILGTLIFCSVFLLGYTISYYKMQATSLAQEDLRYQLLSFQIEDELAGENCQTFNPNRFASEMDRIGSIISLLEERLGKNNAQVLNQKKIYSLLEARHFLYVKKHNVNCNNSVPIILFFYSNLNGYKDEGNRMGYMLTTLKNEDPTVMIYSFDYDLDSGVTDLIKEQYNITSPDKLVINEVTYVDNFTDLDAIKQILA